MANHHVNKVMLDFAYTKEEKEKVLQKTKAFFYDKALPRLNDLLDDVQQDVYINKLEIDVGRTSPEDFALAFGRALAKAFDDLKIEKSNLLYLQPGAGQHPSGEPFFFYLKKGYWPWNYQRKSEKETEAYVNDYLGKEDAIGVLLQQIRKEKEYVAIRFLNLVWSRKERRSLFIKALQKHHPVLESWLSSIAEKIASRQFFPSSFYHQVMLSLVQASSLGNVSDTRHWLKKLVTMLPALTATANENLMRSIERLTDGPLPIRLKVKVLDEMEKHYKARSRTVIEKNTNPPQEASTTLARRSDEEETEKINIGNAGLILFHPFLSYFFEDVKWIDKTKNFVNRRSQEKAILALQYIVNGKSRQREYTLVLNKLLCNWPLHLPLAAACNFSKEEKAALAELSSSLREYWDVLKNTSHRGLIQSFVARPGLVQKTEGGYLLQVERKTIDVLLESLPFAINTIKLPWNEYLIYTEW